MYYFGFILVDYLTDYKKKYLVTGDWGQSTFRMASTLHDPQKNRQSVRSTLEECPTVNLAVRPWIVCEPSIDIL